ncbi:ABC-2 family transporter protein [Fontibacillus panacisegetis]|uniref:ABC-2 family transporter protein n=1 Tax=Fontibacillus panacisegetis TaxID=670482 RepID=A0A1G7E4R4_9BACL|nr:ABC-2 transporter permease [Fontibacillus panacisegetis]SDE58589.1 ABC-2 family transporter protein [Fontibacillus panacisegetis]
MKSLILKDLYNISHNAKSMLFMLLVFVIVIIPMYSVEAYIITSGILCSMMVITTFSFDERSDWTKYAMVTPISRKDLVASKFVVLLIFSAFGVVSGLILGFAGGLITKKVVLDLTSIASLLVITVVGMMIAVIFGSISIPLMFKFGAEKARMLSLISFLLPVAVCFVVYQVLVMFGVSFTDSSVFVLLCSSPMIAAIWNFVMYKISYTIFSRKEVLH